MPPSVDEWLPQRHLAQFVVEVIEGLNLRAMGIMDPKIKQISSQFRVWSMRGYRI
jgi:hypothetical protein